MVRITEDPYHQVVHMHCPRCGALKNVETRNARFAYLEINKFRKEHEDLCVKEATLWKGGTMQESIQLDKYQKMELVQFEVA